MHIFIPQFTLIVHEEVPQILRFYCPFAATKPRCELLQTGPSIGVVSAKEWKVQAGTRFPYCDRSAFLRVFRMTCDE